MPIIITKCTTCLYFVNQTGKTQVVYSYVKPAILSEYHSTNSFCFIYLLVYYLRNKHILLD